VVDSRSLSFFKAKELYRHGYIWFLKSGSGKIGGSSGSGKAQKRTPRKKVK